MKKSFKAFVLMFCLLTGVLLFGEAPIKAEAASVDYQYQYFTSRGQKQKSGKYYFWMETSKEGYAVRLKYAKSRTAKGKTLATAPKQGYFYANFVTNGKKVFYTVVDASKKKVSIMGLTIGKTKKVTYKTDSMQKVSMAPVHVYGNTLYYLQSSGSFPDTKCSVMRMDLKKKKSKTVKKQYTAAGSNGRYIYLGQFKTSHTTRKHYIYDCKTGKSRFLATSLPMTSPYVYGDKLFVVATDTKGVSTIYRYKLSGTGRKTWKTIKLENGAPDQFYNGYLYYMNLEPETSTWHYSRINLKTKQVQTLTDKQYIKYLGR